MPELTARVAAHSSAGRADLMERRLLALEQRIAILESQRRPADAVADVRLLAAIASSVEGRIFSAAELVAHATVDPGLARVLGRLTPVEVGRRLRGLLGIDCDGLTLERIGRDADGIIWHVVSTPRLHEPTSRGAEAGAD